jgi:hypothetical protein
VQPFASPLVLASFNNLIFYITFVFIYVLIIILRLILELLTQLVTVQSEVSFPSLIVI